MPLRISGDGTVFDVRDGVSLTVASSAAATASIDAPASGTTRTALHFGHFVFLPASFSLAFNRLPQDAHLTRIEGMGYPSARDPTFHSPGATQRRLSTASRSVG